MGAFLLYGDLRMKKSLFALAALGAFAGAASAQSSVTVYGVVDVGYVNQKATGAAANTAGTVAPSGQQNSSMFGNSMEQTSRLGFKGTEDLGGGMIAFFTLETDVQPTNASMSSWQTRQGFGGIGKAGVGQFAFGTQYTPMFNQIAATDVGNTNNMPGNAVYPTTNYGNSVKSTGYADGAGVGGQSSGVTVRTQSTLSAQTAVFSGFKAAANYTLRDDTATLNTTASKLPVTNNYSGWGLSGDYRWKQLYVGVAYQSYKSNNTGQGSATGGASASTITTPTPAAWTGAAGGTNSQDNQYYGAATYDFGILKGYLQYGNRKVSSVIDTSYYVKRTSQQIGVRSFMTPTIEGWAVIGNGRYTAYGKNSPSSGFTAYQVGLNYYLSKRTNLYAIYGSNNQSASAIEVATRLTGFALGTRVTF